MGAIKIGKISFSEKLGRLSLTAFRKFWDKSGFDKKTGLSADKAARKFGIKKASNTKE